jgi:hypothetical protein
MKIHYFFSSSTSIILILYQVSFEARFTFTQFLPTALALSEGKINTSAFFSSSSTSTFKISAGERDFFITSALFSTFSIISIFSQANSSITFLTLIHF